MAQWEDEPARAGSRPWRGRMLVLVDGATRSSGESSAWMPRRGLGARVAGTRTAGMIEYGNIAPYLLAHAGPHIMLATKPLLRVRAVTPAGPAGGGAPMMG